nr:PREDICTED: telomerase reverse transcriptase-like [Daucus carota subsp. sativus]
MGKKKRVPEVLWRKYGSKASTLRRTISRLVSPNHHPLPLLAADDPPDYRYLLNHCFVVISDNASPSPPPPYISRWSQSQIVRMSVETMLSQHRLDRQQNVLCYDYDKYTHSSPVISLLTSPTWTLLSQRLGDAIMFYLLKSTCIFLPLGRNKYHQVTGFPMTQSVFKCPKRTHDPPVSSKKRKRIDVDSTLMTSNADSLDAHAFSSCFGCARPTYSTPSSPPHAECRSETSVHGTQTTAGAAYTYNGGLSIGECPATTTTSMPNKKKHSKASKWQREKRRKLLASDEACDVCPEVKSFSNKDNNGKRSRQYRWQRHQKRRLESSQEASNLSQCPKQNTNGDLLTDPRKVTCSCCSVFQCMHKVRRSQIDRQSIFYKLENASGFPSKYMLNSLKPNLYDANILFKNIFGVSDANINSQATCCFHSNHSCITGSKCLYHSLLKHLKELIRKAHLCQHGSFLEKHCTIPSFDQYPCEYTSSKVVGHLSMKNDYAEVKAGVKFVKDWSARESGCVDANSAEKDFGGTAVHFSSSKSYCTKEQVTSFIWAVCRSIVPINLLGTPKAQRSICRNISKLIKLRRFEKFSLKQGMLKLKVSNFPVLSNPHALCYFSGHVEEQKVKTKGCNTADDAAYIMKQRILQSWVLWFFSSLVLPLVQANFYVTESQHGKQDIFYYKHSVWKKIVNVNIACLEGQRYELLNNASVLKIIWNRSFGFSKVRFLPKSTGVRPLANLKASSKFSRSLPLKKSACKIFSSVNSVLHDVHAVLKAIHLKRPERLGYSVFDYNDVHRKLISFLSVLKRGSGIMPRLFIVVADVSKAYESVNQDKLLSVMEDFFSSDKYLLEKFHRVVCTKKSLRVSEHIISGLQDTSAGLRKSMSDVAGPSNCVIVDKEWRKYIKKEELFSTLYEHVKQNVLQIDKRFYLQSVGIPQGSMLSPLLCSIYYGDMENNKLHPYIRKICESEREFFSAEHDSSNVVIWEDASSGCPRYMVLRYIDDFFFVSTSKKLALGFFSRLQRGFPAYNCTMNEGKFGLSFDVGNMLKIQQSRFHVLDDGASYVCWSGLLINCCTLEVQADYTRYLNSHLSSTLTVRWDDKPGHSLETKLFDYLRPKLHPIFYDSNINSAAIVRLNIYQAFVICAMKFHCYVANISVICSLEPRSSIKTIYSALRYMTNLIKKRMNAVHLDSNLHPVLELKNSEVEWLGLTAFIKVLKRKEQRHKVLLSLLKKQLQRSDRPEVSSAMKYAVDDSHSSLIWKIRY